MEIWRHQVNVWHSVVSGEFWYIASVIIFSIGDFETPGERMVQCVRWYLSAFHAGRRSPVAKKPYNPILGETFLCYYQLPGQTSKGVSWTYWQ